MLKALIKYILFSCILLSGYNSLHAGNSKDCAHSFSTKISQILAQYGVDVAQSTQTSVNTNSISASREKENDDLNALFVDDDDDDFFKKHLENNNYSTSLLFSQTLGHFFNYTKNTLPFNKYFSYATSDRHIIFQVFKI